MITVFVSGNSCEDDVNEYLSLLESQKTDLKEESHFDSN